MESRPIINILAPTDFSECAVNALKVAVTVARSHDAKVILLHVVAPLPELYGLQKDRATKEQQQNLLDKQSDKLLQLANSLKQEYGISVDPVLVVGQTVVTICDVGKTLDVDLIVMGTHGINGFREFLIGSNTYGVTEKSNSPVLSVPLSCTANSFDKIMFPVRNIPNAFEKYGFLKILIGGKNAKLVVYGIYKIDDRRILEAYTKISAFVKEIGNEWSNVKLTSVITKENLADEVLERAIEMNCDLIVITAKVTKSIKDFFLGRFAQQMVNHSSLPVLHIK